MPRKTTSATPPPSDTAARWAAWLRGAMRRRFGPDYRNVDLVRASDRQIRDNTVSRWLSGALAEAPSVRLVRIAATALDADPEEALTAAGYREAPPPGAATSGPRAAWSAWLKAAAGHPGTREADARAALAAIFGAKTVHAWWEAERTASAEDVITVARVLDRDPVEALRAAGHDVIADVLAEPRHLTLVRTSELPDDARREAEDYVRREEDALVARIAQYMQWARDGARIRAERERDGNGHAAS
jgi:hypothetical protein